METNCCCSVVFDGSVGDPSQVFQDGRAQVLAHYMLNGNLASGDGVEDVIKLAKKNWRNRSSRVNIQSGLGRARRDSLISRFVKEVDFEVLEDWIRRTLRLSVSRYKGWRCTYER